MNVVAGNEWVYRARCAICGSSGPMSASSVGAAMLALLCGWSDEPSRCMNCLHIIGQKKPAKNLKPKKVKPILDEQPTTTRRPA